ncbi:DoxX family protein [Roseiarcaceae bacterium H3SJ34-1]|uniref:DoxX family protein n=1 Tax=Terripilifer ovatus TaxID=3032367 RepID=UPI003AB98E30|nr:DoxX family protein [Roseiarcaceae bacterium H3SJ34-1]
MNAQTRYLPALGRLLIAVIFIFAGFGKIAAPVATQGYIASTGLPFPLLGYLLAVLVEAGGGVLLLIGYQTRLVALVLALFSVATAVIFHNDFADQNMMIHFLKNIAMAGGLLQVVAFGAGGFSVDSWRGVDRLVPASA